MTHFETYNEIINFRKSNPLPEDQYGEKHHIVPKSVCPILKDAPDNIVRLSAQEHFLAHYHLWLAYRDELREKKWAKSMCFAIRRMKQQLVKCDDAEAMAKLYEEARIEFCKFNSERMKGKPSPWKGRHPSEETRTKMSIAKNGFLPWNTGKHISGFSGKHHTDITRKKMSESQRGHKACAYGKHWFTNGNENRFVRECPCGFVKGRVRK